MFIFVSYSKQLLEHTGTPSQMAFAHSIDSYINAKYEFLFSHSNHIFICHCISKVVWMLHFSSNWVFSFIFIIFLFLLYNWNFQRERKNRRNQHHRFVTRIPLHRKSFACVCTHSSVNATAFGRCQSCAAWWRLFLHF